MAFNTKVTPEIEKLTELCIEQTTVDVALYSKYDVKRGLRDVNGKGVLTGLTQISNIVSFKKVKGKEEACDGELEYRGVNIEDLTQGFLKDNRQGFEESAYLLLFGKLPSATELEDFNKLLASQRSLPRNFVRDVIMKAPSKNIMNTLSRSVLMLYAYDSNPEDVSLDNVMRQCLSLISVFPMLSVYCYQAYNHYIKGKSLYIHSPSKDLSTAENILRMLRPDKKYTAFEAKILDLALVLHMEHGGGNNSTFTTHVVSSSGSDTYATIAAALGSLKGPKHGGANIKVVKMFNDMKRSLKGKTDDASIEDYLRKLLNREVFDKRGLIYGMGHAVYSNSDPRAVIFKRFVEQLAHEKGRDKDYQLYSKIEALAPKIIGEERHIYKGVSANIDFYSGFVYSMLDLPLELYTPMFAIARIVGWSAHRMEELINTNKIIRPGYVNVKKPEKYVTLEDR